MTITIQRTLKAYKCEIEGYDDPALSYGVSASKARMKVWRELRDHDVSVRIPNISVRRWQEHDIHFPPMPAVASQIDEFDREIIVHTYGGGTDISPKQWGYRDHYCCDPKDECLLKLATLGLFDGPHGSNLPNTTGMWEGSFFYLTDEGKELARALIGERECGEEEKELAKRMWR